LNPVDVDGKCHVRAQFHPKTDAGLTLSLNKKMSLELVVMKLLYDDSTFVE
jgi:hypothetical protein